MLAIMCIVFGIIVIVFPNLFVWIVGLFLVIQGALPLTDILEQKRPVTSVNNSKADHCSQFGTRKKEKADYHKEWRKRVSRIRQGICLDSSHSSNHVHYLRLKQRKELIELGGGKCT